MARAALAFVTWTVERMVRVASPIDCPVRRFERCSAQWLRLGWC